MTEIPTIVAEWQQHRASWMCWPRRAEPWGSEVRLGRARQTYADIARMVSVFEPVKMAVAPEDAAGALHLLGPSVELFIVPLDDGRVRDTGPTFLKGSDGAQAMLWRFNGRGGRYQLFDQDAQFASRLAMHLNLPCRASELVCEGGAIHTDGEGTLLVTEQCLLNPNRNPGLSRRDVEARLLAATGTEKVIWLGNGFADDETDGHIDNIACFIAPGRVLLGVPAFDSAPGKEAIDDARARLAHTTDAAGRRIEVIEVEQPRHPHTSSLGQPLPASYINFAFVNGGIILPAFDENNDARAVALFHTQFPERKIVQIDVHAVMEGGGLHSITLPEPTS